MLAAKATFPGIRAPAGRRLLVAEDDRAFRELLTAALRVDGHEVVAVSNGIELVIALERSLEEDGGRNQFDLVISDVRMPGGTGLEAIDELGCAPGHPPVIFITAFGDEEVHRQAHEIGALAVLDKPLDVDDLRLLVSNYFAVARRHS